MRSLPSSRGPELGRDLLASAQNPALHLGPEMGGRLQELLWEVLLAWPLAWIVGIFPKGLCELEPKS